MGSLLRKRRNLFVSDEIEQVEESNVFSSTLLESKLYLLARNIPLFQELIPDINTQMGSEIEIDEMFPREPDDEDHTRILINYSNLKGNPVLFKLLDKDRLDRVFDLDGFMNGLMLALQKDISNTNPEPFNEATVQPIILTTLNLAVTTVLGINTEGVTERTANLSNVVLCSLMAVLFNDALDVIIAVNDLPLKEGANHTETVIVGMWIVKSRTPKETVVEN